MKTLYISDLDGTLLNSKKEISDFSVEAINKAIESDMLFTVATARMPYGCDYRLEQLNMNIPGILTNGVFLYDFQTRMYIHAEEINQRAADKVLKAFKEHGKSCFMYIFKEQKLSIYFDDKELKQQDQYYSERALKSCEKVSLVEDCTSYIHYGMVVYFALTGMREELEPIALSLSQIEDVNYSLYLNIYNGLYCLEVYSKNASKSHALTILKEIVKCDEVVAFGDNHNDVPLIEAADRSYAPQNALDVVKEKVTAVIDSCDQDGVAKFLLQEMQKG